MSDPNKSFEDVSSPYGAPMGRPAITENPEAKVRLFRVRFVDGDYDLGGAYWGGYPSQPLYCALGDGFRVFVRAADRDQAKSNLRDRYPGLKYYR